MEKDELIEFLQKLSMKCSLLSDPKSPTEALQRAAKKLGEIDALVESKIEELNAK